MFDLETLNRKIDWIRQAPDDRGEIQTLCVRPAEGERLYPDQIEFCCQRGVVGDRWLTKTWMHLDDGSPDPRLQVCILQKRVLDLIWLDRDNTPYPADNLIADMNLGEDNLPAGSKLSAGSAVLEVSDVFNTACSKWRDRYGGESLRWINHPDNLPFRLRGILCQVVQNGTVTLQDRLIKI